MNLKEKKVEKSMNNNYLILFFIITDLKINIILTLITKNNY